MSILRLFIDDDDKGGGERVRMSASHLGNFAHLHSLSPRGKGSLTRRAEQRHRKHHPTKGGQRRQTDRQVHLRFLRRAKEATDLNENRTRSKQAIH